MGKHIRIGLIAGLILLGIYIIILSIANSFTHAIEQFLSMWYWIAILVVGFGTQVGLYSYIRYSMKEGLASATAEVATSGGISTTSMIACCAHHLVDILPIIGLSAAAIFLLKYQIPLMLLGIFSNLAGITMMLNIIQKHRLFNKKSSFKGILRYDMKTIRNVTIILSIIIVSAVFVNAALSAEEFYEKGDNTKLGIQLKLPLKTNNEGGVSIEINPVDFSYDKEVKFDIAINTHQGSLDFDLTEISILEDEKGNKYQASGWEGSKLGGHHRYGILTFPILNQQTSSIKLTIKNVYGIPERVFLWELSGVEK